LIALSTRHLRGDPTDPSRALAPLAARGFREIVLGLADLRADGRAATGAERLPGFGVVAVSAGESVPGLGILVDREAAGLASRDESVRAAAVTAIRMRAAAARAARAPVVVTRMGSVALPSLVFEREARARRSASEAAAFRADARAAAAAALEPACRSLHEICRSEPDVVFAVESPAFGHELGSPDDFDRLFRDVKARNIAAWFSCGTSFLLHAAGLGPEPAAVLEPLAPRLAGVFLSDEDGERDGLVPGRGRVDFKLVSFFLSRGVRRVIDLAPGASIPDFAEAAEFLAAKGIS